MQVLAERYSLEQIDGMLSFSRLAVSLSLGFIDMVAIGIAF